ncbi:MAG: iron-sulfur cluster insertion protein ErpA [Alphaproteobacteria bacterium]|nr:iron-sulfur cluster insertion protein ErpA [Alphaproteobacteria bacterium]
MTDAALPGDATIAPGALPGPVSLSPSAVVRLRELLAAEGRADLMLRIAVNGGGCSGFTYSFSFDDAVNSDDRTFAQEGLTVVVDEASLDLVGGSVVNYVETLGAAAFRLDNPNATASCGCGSSFSV